MQFNDHMSVRLICVDPDACAAIPFRASIISLFDIVKYVSSPSNVRRAYATVDRCSDIIARNYRISEYAADGARQCSPFALRVLFLGKKNFFLVLGTGDRSTAANLSYPIMQARSCNWRRDFAQPLSAIYPATRLCILDLRGSRAFPFAIAILYVPKEYVMKCANSHWYV